MTRFQGKFVTNYFSDNFFSCVGCDKILFSRVGCDNFFSPTWRDKYFFFKNFQAPLDI